MDKIPYTTNSGLQQFKPVVSESELWQDRNVGFCLACGNEQDGCEPDARKRICISCNREKVYGLEELLIMGLLIISEQAE